jgi:hypothetical protein
LDTTYLTEHARMLQARLLSKPIRMPFVKHNCIGATILSTNHGSITKTHILVTHGTVERVYKKIKERVTGDYVTSPNLPAARPHSLFIPPIRYASARCNTEAIIKTLYRSALYAVGDYNDEHSCEIDEGLVDRLTMRSFPVQFRKGHIIHRQNEYMSLGDIRAAYMKALKPLDQVSIVRDKTQVLLCHDSRSNLCSSAKQLAQEVNGNEFCGIYGLD